jgi:hypothetical protein
VSRIRKQHAVAVDILAKLGLDTIKLEPEGNGHYALPDHQPRHTPVGTFVTFDPPGAGPGQGSQTVNSQGTITGFYIDSGLVNVVLAPARIVRRASAICCASEPRARLLKRSPLAILDRSREYFHRCGRACAGRNHSNRKVALGESGLIPRRCGRWDSANPCSRAKCADSGREAAARSQERVARSQESRRNFVDAKFRTNKSGLILFTTA